jgi:2-haloacid dehalogenase
MRLAALTNSTEQVARAQLEHAGLLDAFEPVLSADMVRRLKPAAGQGAGPAGRAARCHRC